MPIVNMHEAKSQLSKLVEAALRGEEVVIAKAGKPRVRVVPWVKRRRLGGLAGTISDADLQQLLSPLPSDVIDSFHESDVGQVATMPDHDERTD